MQPLRSTLLWASHSPRVERFVRGSAAMRPLVSRFMPGEELSAAIEAVRRLQREGQPAVLSYLGENVRDDAAADQSARQYDGIVVEVTRGGYDAQISIKLTQLGWDVDPAAAIERLRRLVAHAAVHGVAVCIDMESSTYVDGAIAAFTEVTRGQGCSGQGDRRGVGLCLQAYLRRTGSDLDRLLPLRPRLRLVKGAYLESAAVAFQSKREIDERYLTLARRMLMATADGAVPSFGTHDLALIERIRREARSLGVPASAYDIQMLYGIQTDGLRALAAQGQRTRVFICYGKAWYPWFMRRLAERPANLLTALRNVT